METMRRVRLDREQRCSQILAEAGRIIGERGYYGFGLQELAQRCGLTKAGLLHFFGSKDQLLVALLRDRDRRDEDAVTAVTRAETGEAPEHDLSREGVVTAFRAIVTRNAGQPEMVRLYAMLRAEALNRDHPAHLYFERREAAAMEIFAQMVAGHVAHPRSTARQIMALMSGLEVQWLREHQGFDLVAEWDRGVERLLTPLS